MLFPTEINMKLQYRNLAITFAAIKYKLPIVSDVSRHWVRSEINQSKKT